jgi:glutaredoxin
METRAARAPALASTSRRARDRARDRARAPARAARRRVVAASADAASGVGSREGDAADAADVVVAVVTTSSCPHCRRVKSALADASVPFVEIDASSENGIILRASTSLSGMRTVPQVYVGAVCFGGADDVEEGLRSGAFAAKVASAKDEGAVLPPAIARAMRESAVAAKEEKEEEEEEEKEEEEEAEEASDDDAEYAALDALATRMAAALTPRDVYAFGGWRAPLTLLQCVLDGATITRWLATAADESTAASTRGGAAAELGGKMMEYGLLTSASASEAFEDDGGKLYRLADHACEPRAYPKTTPAPLNARRRRRRGGGGDGKNAGDAAAVAASLRKKILALYDAHLSEDGRSVDYAAMRTSRAFREYVDATEDLRSVDPRSMRREEKIAFFLNVYNALVVHVTAVVGAPDGFFDRLTYFGRYKYEIGGCYYSCDDIEHGILRGNRPGAASLGAIVGKPGLSRGPFDATSDPRAQHVVLPVDPRIHFALVCGAKSCPPIRTYTGEGLDAQLAAAAEAFCEGDVQVVLSDDTVASDARSSSPANDRLVVRVSKIIGTWYKDDFGDTDEARLRTISTYLRPDGDAARRVRDALDGAKRVTLESPEYDWSLNGTTTVE